MKNHMASIHDYQQWITDAPSPIFTEGSRGGGGVSLGFNSGQSTQRKSEIHSCPKQTTGSNYTICMKLKASWNLNIRLRAAKVRFTQSEFRILYALHNLGERKKRRKKVTLGSRFTLSRGPQAYELCLVNTLFQISLCIYYPGISFAAATIFPLQQLYFICSTWATIPIPLYTTVYEDVVSTSKVLYLYVDGIICNRV